MKRRNSKASRPKQVNSGTAKSGRGSQTSRRGKPGKTKSGPRLAGTISECRVFGFEARFTPEGPAEEDARRFQEFRLEAEERRQVLQVRELARRKRRALDRIAATEKTTPIIRSLLNDEISPDKAAARLKRVIKDEELRREVMDHWAEVVTITPEKEADETERLACERADIRRRERLLKIDKAIHRGYWALVEAATAGDVTAAEYLAETAIAAASWLLHAENSQPDLFKKIARSQVFWPVLAQDEPDWERSAASRIAALDVGADLRVFRTRFRQARGTDANLPARLWAKAAVRVVEETRWRGLAIARLVRGFSSSRELAHFCTEAGWKLRTPKKWADGAYGIAPFAKPSLANWKKVVRAMIREEVPDFHLRPEWANQRRTAERRGRDTIGEIQNAILDDIISALERLAPG